MQLDIRTLLVAAALATAFCSAARFLLWRMHPDMPGLGRWALASVLGVIAFALIAIDGFVWWLPSLALAQALIVFGFLIIWDGFRAFLGRPSLSTTTLALFALATLVLIGISQFEDSLELRTLINAALVAILSALIARELLRSGRRDWIAQRATGWIYAANALFFLVRAVASGEAGRLYDPWAPGGFAAFVLLWWLCTVMATTLGMVLMAGERLQADLDRQASLDPLTGALNRRSFAFFVSKEVSRAHRHRQPLSALMMDLDHFKEINDRLGHSFGDAVLCRFVAVAEQELRNEDIFCRFGGEEFVALLPGTTIEQASVAAERLRKAFAEETGRLVASGDPLEFTITVSIGIGALDAAEDFDGLLRRADEALYRAKAAGRNRCESAVAGQPAASPLQA